MKDAEGARSAMQRTPFYGLNGSRFNEIIILKKMR
jgi:hypothetical protein